MKMRAGDRCSGIGRTAAALAVGAAVALVLVLAPPTSPSAASVPGAPPAEVSPPIHTITNIDQPGMGTPTSIVRAATGDLWFLDHNAVGRVTTAGAVTVFRDPGIVEPVALVAGADGNVWFANARDTVGRITPAGAVSTFAFPSAFGTRFTDNAVSSADGLLWFGVKGGPDGIGSGVLRITTAGVPVPLEDRVGGGVEWFETPLAAGADGWVWYERYEGNVRRYRNGVDEPIIGATLEGHNPLVDPVRMAVAADGDLWFTTTHDAIGRLTPAGAFTNFTDPAIHDPQDIVFGPDGALWFTNGSTQIGRMTIAGSVTVFADPSIDHPQWITLGSDGALWFSNAGSATIGRLTTAGGVTTFTKKGMVDPDEIVLGPDGAMWFSNGPSSIGRVDREASVTVFSDPSLASPRGFTVGNDGALWFTNTTSPSDVSRRGRIAMDGAVSSFPWYVSTPGVTTFGWVPAADETVQGSALGPDGNLWLTLTTTAGTGNPPTVVSASILRVTPAGQPTRFALPTPGLPGVITAGPDGAMWFVDGAAIGRVTVAGAITLFPVGPPSVLATIATGADGALWFTQRGNDTIGRLSGEGVITRFTHPTVHAPAGLAAGPDGAMWFTNTATQSIGRITTTVSAAFHPLKPTRLLDSRTATGGWSGALTAGAPRTLTVTGGLVPSTASAVVLNVTVTAATAGSFLSLWPAGEPPPTTSTMNFAAGQTIANLSTIQVGPGGGVTFQNHAGAAHVVADVLGYYDDGTVAGDRYHPSPPRRVYDSRSTSALDAGHPRDIDVGAGGLVLPSTATAVVANVTATDSTAGSYLTAWRSGDPRPITSNLNFGAGQTIANLSVIPVAGNGWIRLATAVGSTHVVIDVVGWFDSASGLRFHATSPHRVLDDRIGHGAPGPWGPGITRAVASAGPPVVAAGALTQVLNVTATNGSTGSYLEVTKVDVPPAGTSTVNFGPGETLANLTITALGPQGGVAIRNHRGTVDVVADSYGFFAPY